MSDAFGDQHSQWTEGTVVYSSFDLEKPVSSPKSKFMIKCEIFSVFGIYPQKVLKLYYQMNPYFSRGTRSTGKPIDDLSGSLSDIPYDFTSNPLQAVVSSDVSCVPEMSSKTHMFSTNLLETKGKGVANLVSSVNESKFTIFNIQSMYSEAGDAVGYVQKIYKNNKTDMIRAGKRLDRTMLVVTVLLIGLLIGMTLSALNSSQYASTLDETLNMNRRQELSLLLSLKCREPFLLLSNYSLPSNVETLSSLITELRDQISIIQDDSDSDPIYRSVESTEKGLWWEFEDAVPVASEHNAEDLMRLLASHALPLSQEWRPNLLDRNFLAVLRNGIGESLDTLNRTMYSTINSSKNGVSSKESLLLSMYLTGLTTLTTLLCLIFIFILRKVNAIRKRIWDLLLEIPLAVYLTAKTSSSERIEMHHESELTNMGLDWDSGGRSTGSKTGLKSRVESEWVFLITSASFLVIALVISLSLFYSELTVNLSKFNREIPMLIYISGLRKLALLESQFYLRESHFQSYPYFRLFPTYQKIFNLETELERHLSNLRLFDHILSYTNSAQLSSAQVSLLLDRSYTDSFLAVGVHPAVSALYIDLLAAVHDPSFQDFGNGFDLLESRISAVLTDLETVTHMYRDAACAQVTLATYMHWVETLGIVSGFLVLYFGIVRFFLRKMLNRALEEWRILLYLPRNSAMEIIRLMR